MQKVTQTQCQQSEVDGKESEQEVNQPAQGPQEERHAAGKNNHYFSDIPTIAYKNHNVP